MYNVQMGQDEAEEGATQNITSKPPSDEEVLDYFNQVYSMADTARQPREQVWKQAWDLYNGIYDWAGKAEWQSKVNISLVRQAVDRAAATFRRALVRMRNFFGVEAESKLGYQQGLFTKTLLDYWLDRAEFIREFTTALKVGLITSTIILKVYWEYCWENDLDLEETTTEVPIESYGLQTGTKTVRGFKPKRTQKLVGKLGIKAVDPLKFWVVPGSDNRYVIELTESLVSDLQQLAKKGIYDKAAVDRLSVTGAGTDAKSQEEADRAGELSVSKSGWIKQVKLFHYWGDILDKDGKILMADATFTVAASPSSSGGYEVIRKPRANPFYHGKHPYVMGTPYVVPFSTYNRGIVEDVAGVATMITELSNLIADGAMFDAIKAYEIDVDQLVSPAEAADGIYPGKTFRKKGLSAGPIDKPLVRAIDVGRLPQEAIHALGYFDAAFQKGTQVTELVSGMGSSGSKTDPTEVSSKTRQALEGLDDAARTVEETVIQPCLEIAAKTIYQFHTNYDMPRLQENFPEASQMLAEMSPAERYVLMIGKEGFQFKARGISIMLDKGQNLEKVGQFLQISAHIPGILQRLNVDAVLEEIVMGLGWNPQKILLEPTPQVTTPGAPPAMGVAGPQRFPPPGEPTPAQAVAAQQGATQGGAVNNPMAGESEGAMPLMQQLMGGMQ